MRENRTFTGAATSGATVVATMALSMTLGMTLSMILGAVPAAVTAAPTPVGGQAAVPAPASGGLVAPARLAQQGPLGTSTTARWSGALDTSSKEAVNRAYWTRYAPKFSLPIGWLGGSILNCLPGLSSLTSNKATLSALNFARSLGGLAPVSFSRSLNASAQRAALIMDANNTLSHSPGSNWRCWSRTGAAAAGKSNLALAWPSIKSGQVIEMYMDDKGNGNQAAGHRRWLMNPFATVMGNGSTSTANALTVIGPNDGTNPNPRYVGWPTAGWFPSTMEPAGRWSLSAGLRSVDFRTARVTVYRNGHRVPATKLPVHNGYAQPTLVWQLAPSVPRRGNFRVVVSNIRRPGMSPMTHSYRTYLFSPYR